LNFDCLHGLRLGGRLFLMKRLSCAREQQQQVDAGGGIRPQDWREI
jgi:hypothetical protein